MSCNRERGHRLAAVLNDGAAWSPSRSPAPRRRRGSDVRLPTDAGLPPHSASWASTPTRLRQGLVLMSGKT